MELQPQNIVEHIRIKARSVTVNILTASGKEGDHYIVIAPSILVSGYGDTPEEAEESFRHNIDVFCHDLAKEDPEERSKYLISLGFKAEKFQTRNYSKVYVDKDGVLRGFEPSSIVPQELEAAITEL
ncbi:MAG: hypothetical protein IBJ09_09900 [Bacteroidia bacterium]|nr:hypothetical protein [Bacteroidia bacterium]